MKKYIYALTLLFGVCLLCPDTTQAGLFRKKRKTETEQKEEKLTSYEKLFKGKNVETARGVMTIHKVGDKIYVEFPLALLQRDMILTSSIEKTSDTGEGYAGEFGGRDARLRFTRQDSTLQARMILLSEPLNSSENPEIGRALEYSNAPGIFKSFKILAYTPDSSAVVVDMKKLFFESSTYTKPFPSLAANAYYGFISRKHRLQSDKSLIRTVDACWNNISVECEMSFLVDHTFMGFSMYEDVPLTATIHKILMLLPEDKMKPRIADSRIGTATVLKSDFLQVNNGVKEVRYAKRWKIEPSDSVAWQNGECVEPVKPITFYVDSLMPETWKPYIRKGVLAWNAAFERIGFKDVIRVVDFPKNDTLFNANNINYSTIRYAPIWLSDVGYSIHSDARSGEIFNASIVINSNVITNAYYQRICATMTSDPRVRVQELPDDLLGELIQGHIAQAVGACLGLTSNPGASYAYPTDSLRSATFTRKYGLSPSIMDGITCNYLASAEDVAQGVTLVQNTLGDYDYFAIKWLYSPIMGLSAGEERLTLDRWLREQEQNPYCQYIKRESGFQIDPRAQLNDLGNDQLLALQYALPMIRESFKNYFTWYAEGDRDLTKRANIRSYLYYRFTDKVNAIYNDLGGVYLTDSREGYTTSNYRPIPKNRQKEVLAYALKLSKDLDWMDTPEEAVQYEIQDKLAPKYRIEMFTSLLYRMDYIAACASLSEDPYTPEEFLNDIYAFVWEPTLKRQTPDQIDMALQQAFLESIIQTSSATLPAGQFAARSEYGLRTDNLQVKQELFESSIKKLQAGMSPERLYDLTVPVEQISGFEPLQRVRVDESAQAALYFNLLERTEKMLRNAVAQSQGETKMHYDLMLYKIQKATEIR